ncbi:MAG: TonB-dependent receptor [bacterium]
MHRIFSILTTISGGIVLSTAVALADSDTATNQPSGGGQAGVHIEVTARKWSEPLQSVPGAVTIRTADSIEKAGIQDLRDAARHVPNLTLGDFSVRRLTFPFVRGIGSGRNSPAVSTCIDGVPQLSYATANQQMVDIDRIEFLRGSQGALYGRNSLGGVINILPRLPARDQSATLSMAGGDYGLLTVRGSAEGAIAPETGAGSIGAGYSRRDGFSENDTTGHAVDNRDAWFGRAQAFWPDQGAWSLRLSIGGECDRDGDYALYDLASIRARPHHISRDYEGTSYRDTMQPVFTALRSGERADIASITAFQWWQSRDRTDLDATEADLLRRENRENQRAWLEEVRLSSPADAPVKLADHLSLRWLAGVFFFDATQTQRAFNDYRAGAVEKLGLPFQYRQHDDATLGTSGGSVFCQTTLTIWDQLELGMGLRHDYEHSSADLTSYSDPSITSQAETTVERDFNRTSPRATVAYHITPAALVYVEAASGYKAGGVNAQSPLDKSGFDEETSRTYEAGLKTGWYRNRLVANTALFIIDWDNLQMDVPQASVPGSFYIDNVGRARSSGGELELTARATAGLNIFGSVGLLSSGFRRGSASGGSDVGGNDLPFAPRTCWNAGLEYSRPLSGSIRASFRLEAVGTGRYYYDASNSASQGDLALANARMGLSSGAWRIECWVDNLTDRDYVPVALPYPLAQSGYIGEAGAPRTFGASIRRAF